MRDSLLITDVAFTPASTGTRDAGLAGYIECTANGELRLCGLTLRKKSQGGHAISFPFKLDARGVRRPFMRPLDTASRRDIERQILGALRKQGRLA